MDTSKIPILNKIDFSDRTTKIKFFMVVSAVILAIVLIIIILSPSPSEQRNTDGGTKTNQPGSATVVAQPIPIQSATGNDNLSGKSNTAIYGSGRGGKRLAEQLFVRDTVNVSEDPLAEMMKEGRGASAQGNVILPGQTDVYGTASEPAPSSGIMSPQEYIALQQGGVAEQPTETPSREASHGRGRQKHRERLIAMGIDPDTGEPIENQPAEPKKTSGSTSSSASPVQESPRQQAYQPDIRTNENTEDFDDDDSFGLGTTRISSVSSQTKRSDGPSIKVMFIEEKKVRSGDRVQLRLCEDKGMTVEGIHIPKNSLLYANVTLGERLEIKVPSVNVNGRIIPLNLEAYDVDGLKGIYCPTSEGEQALKEGAREAQQIGSEIVSGIMRSFGARIINRGSTTADRITSQSSAYITSGYSFRLMKAE